MRLPNDGEIAAAKADAMARFGRAEILQINMAAPIDMCVLVAPWNLAAYEKQSDEQLVDAQTAYRNVAVRQRVWPMAPIDAEGKVTGPDPMIERMARRPALAFKIVAKLSWRAGYRPGEPACELLSDVIARTAVGGDALPGLPRVRAEALLKDADRDAELWAVTGPGSLACVMQTPEGEVWSAAQSAWSKAAVNKERLIASKLDFARQAVVWIERSVEAHLDDLPAHASDICTAYERLGGDGADTTCKSL